MIYEPESVPYDAKYLVEYLARELPRLAAALNDALAARMPVMHIAPDKPVTGLYYADGSDWDPGAGRGLYRYDDGSATYTFLG